MKSLSNASIALAFVFAAPLAFAHVSIDPSRVEAGTTYQGVLRIGHGCDAAPTTSLDVQVPGGGMRTFDAKDKKEIPIEFAAPKQPGPLWIRIVQRCGAASVNWVDAPTQSISTEGVKTPAALVQVLSREDMAAYKALPTVEGGWVRASVPGQTATGAFMRITAKEPMKLVGASSPVAGTAAVHEMKMEGDVMKMRPAGVIDLPAGGAFELKPSGYHLMLQDLKQPLAAGNTVAVTLVFRNAKGADTRMDLRLPVSLQAPGAKGGEAAAHKH